MKYRVLFILTFFSIKTYSQSAYFQQKVNYQINVQLNDNLHTLDGMAKIRYINRSPDTLGFIWFHLWPNAYKNDRTAFSDHLLENGRTDFYFSEEEQRGYINRLDFRVNNQLAQTEDHPSHIDIVKVILPSPLLPGDSIHITTPFHVKLPFNFSRGGHIGKSYQITQWYPKPAVYDQQGWHPMPYLDQGEFYAELGDYQVDITLPQTYHVLSSGELINPEEDVFMQTLQLVQSSKISTKQTTNETAVPVKTLRFQQNNMHDFAWFAAKNWVMKRDTVTLASGKKVTLHAAFLPQHQSYLSKAMESMKKSVLQKSIELGEYAYPQLSIVDVPSKSNGGMEYPCIATVSSFDNEKALEEVIVHEIGHNWFQGMVGNNEREHAWMDEGLNSYFDRRWKEKSLKKKIFSLEDKYTELLLRTYEKLKIDQPVQTPSADFSSTNYFLSSYHKAANIFERIEQRMSRPAFDSAIRQYVHTWSFKHPQPQDLFQILQQNSSHRLDTLFDLFHNKGSLPITYKKNLRIGFAPSFNMEAKNQIWFSPLPAYNYYDGLMVGGLISNDQLAPPNLRFVFAPLYGIQSKAFNYAGRVSYSWYPDNRFSHIQVGLSAMKFTTNDYTDSAGKKTFTGFRKWAPFVKVVRKPAHPRSTKEQYVQWKGFYLEEDALRFSFDTTGGGRRLNVATLTEGRFLQQLELVMNENRVLYPYQSRFLVEYAKEFTRLSFTGQSYFNYNEKEGAHVRFFVGKFIYNGSRTTKDFFNTSRYHLNMTGPRGREDYTYTNYFVGRNEFEGLLSRQLMMRDGGFKVGTDLLADKVGRSDNWLMALNLVSDIPRQINILDALPIKIPLKFYLDIGTYAEAWDKNFEGSRILYNAGLQLPLLKNTIQVYFPILYSKVYRDYFTSTLPGKKFWNTISFSIDIQQLKFNKLDKNLPF